MYIQCTHVYATFLVEINMIMYVYIYILYINTDSPVPCWFFSMHLMGSDRIPHGSLAGCLGLVVWRWPIWIPLQLVSYSISWGLFITSCITSFHHTSWFYLSTPQSTSTELSISSPSLPSPTFFTPFSFTSTDPILATRPPAATMRAISSFSCGLWSRVSCLAKLFRPSMPQLGGFFGSLVEVMHGWMSYKGLSLGKLVETRKKIIKCWILMDERKYCWTPNLCFAEKSTCPSLPQHLSPLFYTAMSNTSNVEPDPQLNGAKAPPTTTLLSPTLSHWAWARVRLESYRSCCFCWDQKTARMEVWLP